MKRKLRIRWIKSPTVWQIIPTIQIDILTRRVLFGWLCFTFLFERENEENHINIWGKDYYFLSTNHSILDDLAYEDSYKDGVRTEWKPTERKEE